MSAVKYALNQLRHRIPNEVLREAFQRNRFDFRAASAPVSMDEMITVKVIRGRVFDDCDTVGGEHVLIPLFNIPSRRIDLNTMVYEIPAERINNRTIMSALSVHYYMYSVGLSAGNMDTGFYAGVFPNDLISIGQRVMDAVGSVPATSNANVELVAHNTVVVRDMNRVTSTYMLRCVVSNDGDFNNLHPRSYMHFAKLVEFAVKAWIYNNLVVQIDNAYLSGGQELGVVKQIVEGYADAEENYQTYLKEVWAKVAFMNDKRRNRRFMAVQINPAL